METEEASGSGVSEMLEREAVLVIALFTVLLVDVGELIRPIVLDALRLALASLPLFYLY